MAERVNGRNPANRLPQELLSAAFRLLDPIDCCAAFVVCRHCCRIALGDARLFRELNVDCYFLEWENERSGDFKPLRFLPPGKVVVLGLISTKESEMEKKEDIIAKVHEAAKYAPLEQLALSPQCGFSSTEEGNNISEETQWAKMRLVLEIAKEVWPDA